MSTKVAFIKRNHFMKFFPVEGNTNVNKLRNFYADFRMLFATYVFNMVFGKKQIFIIDSNEATFIRYSVTHYKVFIKTRTFLYKT